MQIQNLQTLTKNREGTAIGVFLLIGVVAIYNWVVSPHVALLVASQRYARAANQRIETAEAINEEVRLKRDELEGLLVERAKWSYATFDVAGADEFLRSLQVLCREAGCTHVSVSYLQAEEVTVAPPESTTDWDDEAQWTAPSLLVAKGALMTVQGGYEDVVALIDALQSHCEKVWIDSLEISALRSSAGQVSCKLSITVHVTSGKEMEQDE